MIKKLSPFSILISICFILITSLLSAQTSPVPYNSSGTFTVPAGVTQITVECWGAGGRGATLDGNGEGGGGGGGAYSKKVISVVPGTNYTVTVGVGSTSDSPGGDSWFWSASTVLAKGGESPPTGNSGSSTQGALGGSAVNSIGDLKYSGGKGSNKVSNDGGGGGSSAGPSGNGINCTTVAGANGSSVGGGNGGNGQSSNDGNGHAGSQPGGGGGGATRTGSGMKYGGKGGDGRVIISWCSPPNAPTANAGTSAGCTQFTANWSAVAGATSYRLDVSTSSGFGVFVDGYNNLNVGGLTSDIVTGLSAGVTYYYRVRAYSDCGISLNSGTINSATTAVPATPGAISGTVTQCPSVTGQVYSITAVPGATGYRWYVPAGWTVTSGSNTNSITVTTGSTGQNGNISVEAANTCGPSPLQSLPVTVGPGTPNVPASTNGTNATCTQFSANWNTAVNATSYHLDVSTVNTFASFVSGYNDLNVSNVITYNVTGLTAGVTYYYRVRSANNCGTSLSSGTITYATLPATPAAPVSNAGSGTACTQITANWQSSTNATSYRLDVSTVNTFTSFVSGYNDLNVGNVTTFNVTGLTAGVTYYYRVRAVNICGTSSNSGTITYATLPAAPTAPVTNAGSGATCTQITANWESSTNTTSYRLDVSTVNTFASFVIGYEDLNVGNVITYNVTGLSAGVTYYYRVKAVNSCGRSSNSITITYATLPATPSIPGTISGSAAQCPALASQSYSISAVTNATTYTWAVPTGWMITSGQGTTLITVTTGTVGQNGNVTVSAGNYCGTSEVRTLAVIVNTIPTINNTTNGSRCGTGTVSLSATASAGTINWYAASTGGLSLGTGTNYTTPSISSTTSYWVDATSNGCTTGTRTEVVATVHTIPIITGTTAGSRVGTGTVNLSASSAGGIIYWYQASTGGSSIGVGTDFTTPVLSSTTSYYVSVFNGYCYSTPRTAVVATVYSTSDYRTISSGDWNSLSTWERWNGSVWETLNGVIPRILPTVNDETITIRSGHSVTLTETIDTDQCLIEDGGQVTINQGVVWNIVDGPGVDLNVEGSILNSGKITISGTLELQEESLLDTGNTVIDGSGNFLLYSGAGLKTANSQGVSYLASTGCIQVGGQRYFDTNGIYTFNGTTTQSTGDALENAKKLIIDNAEGVVVSSDVIVGEALIINNNKRLVVPSVVTLTVNGSLINNGGENGLVLKSDSSGTASLIHSTADVPATVERYISGAAEDWHFLSAPISNQEISGSWLPSGTYGNGTGYDLYLWNEPTQCWVYKNNENDVTGWDAYHNGVNFSTGRGYLYSVQAFDSNDTDNPDILTNPTKEFKGNLNNGFINYPLTYTNINGSLIPDIRGYNFVGNPYPSSIDWSAAEGWSRSNLETTAGGYDMWIWNPTANNYGVYNSATAIGTESISRYIAPMQGFFVRAATSGSLGIDNAVRVHNGAGSWFRNSSTHNSLMRIKVQSETDSSFDEVLLQFGVSATASGAPKFFSHVATAPSLYMKSGNDSYSVNYFTNTTEHQSVPVAFKAGKDGIYTLQFNFEVADFEYVLLEDRLLKFTKRIAIGSSYRFKASTKDYEHRFVLHFVPIDSTTDNELPIRVYTAATNLHVDLSYVNLTTGIEVYDITGRVLLRQNLQGSTLHQLKINSASQVIIVRLKNVNGEFVRKLINHKD